MGQLNDYLEALGALPPEKAQEVVDNALEQTKDLIWVPNPGPQTEAYFSEADETLYGGEAGGGKTDLVIGLSLTAHRRSLVLRRTNLEASKLFDRYEAVVGSREGFNTQRGIKYRGRNIDIGGCQLESDKQKRKGIPHDLKAFDELVDFTESQYLFITTWNRSTDPTQRCRIVATSNPPTTPEGMWVIRRWAAWLDPKHPKPAKSGEIRWYTTIGDKDTEVDGRGPHIVDGKEVYAKSRTFIRSTLDDNPDLTQTDDYKSRLDALPAELRAAYREGKFDAGLKDQAMQIIPTEWIRQAQARWTPSPPQHVPQCAVGVDCSGGGKDPMILAPRYDGWYAPPTRVEGKDIPIEAPGATAAGYIVTVRRNNSVVVLDMGGGYGGAAFEALATNGIQATPYKGSEASTRRTKDGFYGFNNTRTATLWAFREALDPEQPGGSPIMLYPSQTLLVDLAAPTFRIKGGQICAEPKEDVVERLQRSTNEGDAVMMAWIAGPTYITNAEEWFVKAQAEHGSGQATHQVIMGRKHARRR